jgi:hypothetical protein
MDISFGGPLAETSCPFRPPHGFIVQQLFSESTFGDIGVDNWVSKYTYLYLSGKQEET